MIRRIFSIKQGVVDATLPRISVGQSRVKSRSLLGWTLDSPLPYIDRSALQDYTRDDSHAAVLFSPASWTISSAALGDADADSRQHSCSYTEHLAGQLFLHLSCALAPWT